MYTYHHHHNQEVPMLYTLYTLLCNPNNLIVIFRLHKFATLTPGCIYMYTKMCQLKKKPIQCIMGFYIDLAGIAGRANCICKHERLRILLFHCKHQLDINNIRGEHRMDVLKIQGNIYRVNLLT